MLITAHRVVHLHILMLHLLLHFHIRGSIPLILDMLKMEGNLVLLLVRRIIDIHLTRLDHLVQKFTILSILRWLPIMLTLFLPTLRVDQLKILKSRICLRGRKN